MRAGKRNWRPRVFHHKDSPLFRKITNGFRTKWGAKLYAGIRSIIESARRRGHPSARSHPPHDDRNAAPEPCLNRTPQPGGRAIMARDYKPTIKFIAAIGGGPLPYFLVGGLHLGGKVPVITTDVRTAAVGSFAMFIFVMIFWSLI